MLTIIKHSSWSFEPTERFRGPGGNGELHRLPPDTSPPSDGTPLRCRCANRDRLKRADTSPELEIIGSCFFRFMGNIGKLYYGKFMGISQVSVNFKF